MDKILYFDGISTLRMRTDKKPQDFAINRELVLTTQVNTDLSILESRIKQMGWYRVKPSHTGAADYNSFGCYQSDQLRLDIYESSHDVQVEIRCVSQPRPPPALFGIEAICLLHERIVASSSFGPDVWYCNALNYQLRQRFR
jgi:hypothetical protein